jgi:hypothetical protein
MGYTVSAFWKPEVFGTGYLADQAGRCMAGGHKTRRVDIRYGDYFCASPKCNEVLALREAQAQWENEGGRNVL